ncbi:MAG: hypothetical protein OHK0022_21980 [Roseiflexaceae bacterium]
MCVARAVGQEHPPGIFDPLGFDQQRFGARPAQVAHQPAQVPEHRWLGFPQIGADAFDGRLDGRWLGRGWGLPVGRGFGQDLEVERPQAARVDRDRATQGHPALERHAAGRDEQVAVFSALHHPLPLGRVVVDDNAGGGRGGGFGGGFVAGHALILARRAAGGGVAQGASGGTAPDRAPRPAPLLAPLLNKERGFGL